MAVSMYMHKFSKMMCIMIIFILLPSFAGYNSIMCCTVSHSLYIIIIDFNINMIKEDLAELFIVALHRSVLFGPHFHGLNLMVICFLYY